MSITLLVTDKNLNYVGDPIADWLDLNVTRHFNSPASGTLTLPAHAEVADLFQPGNRLVVIRDGQFWCAGPMEEPINYSWGIGDNDEPDPGKITVNFSDDLAIIAGYKTWPSPALAWASQPITTSRTITATNAESIIRTLVNENCGPGALAARQIASLVLDAVTSVGTSVSVTTKFEDLLDVCRRVAIDGGNLGFKTRQDGNQIKFGVYAPADRTGTARFSKGLGNLRSVRYKLSAPTVTHAQVAGGDEASRVFKEVADTTAAASWWRVEKFVEKSDAANDTNGELTQAGKEELASGAAPVELSTVTIDTEDLKAGRDFDLGDRVTLALPIGLDVEDVVRSINLQATPRSGELVTSVVGSPEATTDPKLAQLLREYGRRIGRLEAK